MGILGPTEASADPSPWPAYWFCGSAATLPQMPADGFDVPACPSSKEGRFVLTRNMPKAWMVESSELLPTGDSHMKCLWVYMCEVLQTGCSVTKKKRPDLAWAALLSNAYLY